MLILTVCLMYKYGVSRKSGLIEAIHNVFYDKILVLCPITPPNSKIICGQNVGTKVVCGMILFFEKKAMLKI